MEVGFLRPSRTNSSSTDYLRTTGCRAGADELSALRRDHGGSVKNSLMYLKSVVYIRIPLS